MRTSSPVAVHSLLASALVLLVACGQSAPALPPPTQPAQRTTPTVALALGLNPVALAGLAGTVRIDVLEFSAAPVAGGQPGYVQRLAVTDAKTVAQVVAALNTDMKPLPKAACIPDYELRFQLAGGAMQKLSYGCQGASFLRGDQPAWRDVDTQPPAAFDRLMRELLAAPAAKP
jgi:hypothetical protein